MFYIRLCLILCIFAFCQEVKAQTDTVYLKIKVTDRQNIPVTGVYVICKNPGILLTATDIDGECRISLHHRNPTDTIQFQGMGYETVAYSLEDLRKTEVIRLKELKYDLTEAVATGLTSDHILKEAVKKLKKKKGKNIPLCNYYGPAQYEKITECLDTAVEYRREFGYYFTSGDIKPKNVWDQTHRSYLVPEYIARSYNLTLDGNDTLAPMFLTSGEIRFDVGTRKIFTLIRAVQLFGPLFNGIADYELQRIDSDSPDYVFQFKTKNTAYPEHTRIFCKGQFTVDREKLRLTGMEFEYIDYQLLRQILMSRQRKVSSPFSTRAKLTFAYDSADHYFVRTCIQTTTWKYDLGENFILIEQPSRYRPGDNQLVEKEAFLCHSLSPVDPGLQNNRILTKIHLAQRFPLGNYQPEVFRRLPALLDTEKAFQDIGRYMDIKSQFILQSDRPYYSDNYVQNIRAKKNFNTYRRDLRNARKQLFELFGHCPTNIDF